MSGITPADLLLVAAALAVPAFAVWLLLQVRRQRGGRRRDGGR